MLQRTDEWYLARLGKVTASRISDVIAKTRNGYGASRTNYMGELLLERITGKRTEGFVSAAMQFGTDNEPDARRAYSFYADADVEEVGFILHPEIIDAGCSPDGCVGKSGLVEIKVPQAATHLNTLLTGAIDERYIKQMMFQMACTEREWCDFCSYQPAFPAHLQLFVQRIRRDDELISELERESRLFIVELNSKISKLSTLGHRSYGMV